MSDADKYLEFLDALNLSEEQFGDVCDVLGELARVLIETAEEARKGIEPLDDN